MLARFPASNPAKFGLEVEIGNAWLDDRLPRKTVLAPAQGYTVETDVHAAESFVYPEFVEAPQSSLHAVLDDTQKSVVAFADALYDNTGLEEGFRTTIATVLPNAVPAHADRAIEMQTPLPKTHVQSTGMVAEAHIPHMLDAHPSRALKARIADEANAVESKLQEIYPDKRLSPTLKGYVTAILYALAEAQVPARQVQTAHSYFKFMHRASFSWRYYSNLNDPQDRAMARVLLLQLADGQSSLLAQAIGRRGDERVFSAPYHGPRRGNGESRKVFEGPTLDGFFKSIVNSPVDQMSHLEGYPPGYSLGGMGSGDAKRNLSPYERRNDEVEATANVLSAIAQRHYTFWSRLNPEGLGRVRETASEREAYDNSVRMSRAADDFNTIFASYAEHHGTMGEMMAGMYAHLGAQSGQLSIAHLEKFSDWLRTDKQDDPAWQEPREATGAVLDSLASGNDIKNCLTRLSDAFWNADGYGAGRRERQGAAPS